MQLWKSFLELTITRRLRLGPNAQFLVGASGAVFDWPIVLNYIASLVTQTFYTATRAVRVTSISGRVRVAGTGGACTISFFKVPSGTAVGSGTLLHSGSFNLVGAVDTVQTLVLIPGAGLTLAAGDSIGYVLTGTATSAVGTVSVSVTPV